MHLSGHATIIDLKSGRGHGRAVVPHAPLTQLTNPINVVVFDSEPTIPGPSPDLPESTGTKQVAGDPTVSPRTTRNGDLGVLGSCNLPSQAIRGRANSYHQQGPASVPARPVPTLSLSRAPKVRQVVFCSNSTEIVDRHVTFALPDNARAAGTSSHQQRSGQVPTGEPAVATALQPSGVINPVTSDSGSLSVSLFATPAQSFLSSLNALPSSPTELQLALASLAPAGRSPPPIRVHAPLSNSPIRLFSKQPLSQVESFRSQHGEGEDAHRTEYDGHQTPIRSRSTPLSIASTEEPNVFRRGFNHLVGSIGGLGAMQETSMSPVTLTFRDAILEERFTLFSARLSQYPMLLFSWAITIPVVAQMLMISRSLSSYDTILQGCPMIQGTCYACQHVIFYWVAFLTAILFLLLFTSRKHRSWERQRRHVFYSFIFAGFVASHLGGTVCGGLCRVGSTQDAKLLVDSTLNLPLACGADAPAPVLESLKWLESSLETRTTASSAYMFLLIAATGLPMRSAVMIGVSLLLMLTVCYAILVPSNASLLWLHRKSWGSRSALNSVLE